MFVRGHTAGNANGDGILIYTNRESQLEGLIGTIVDTETLEEAGTVVLPPEVIADHKQRFESSTQHNGDDGDDGDEAAMLERALAMSLIDADGTDDTHGTPLPALLCASFLLCLTTMGVGQQGCSQALPCSLRWSPTVSMCWAFVARRTTRLWMSWIRSRHRHASSKRGHSLATPSSSRPWMMSWK